jgi:hypothetical protein
MYLNFILIITLFLYIKFSSVFTPALFLGPLAIYILGRKYLILFFWVLSIIFVLQTYSITPWWKISIFYLLWIATLSIISKFIDRSWSVQSIVTIFLLILCEIIVFGLDINYTSLGIHWILTSITITIFLYCAEKFNIYEKII